MDVPIPDNFEQIACPACNEPGFASVYVGRDWVLPSDPPNSRKLQVVRCNRCGLAYLNPRPKLSYLGKYYPEEYSPYQRQRGEIERGSALSTAGRLLILKNAYAKPELRPRGLGKLAAAVLSTFKSPESCGFAIEYFGGGKLLDFGCGSGTFLRRMKAMGWDAVGVDFSEAAVKVVRASGVEAHVGTLPNDNLKPASFDLVTMRHALEHVPDPMPILAAAKDLLVPGGMLEIQVPNFAGWEIEHFGDAANTLDIPRHLLHWEPKTLAAKLTEAGYVDVKVEQACRSSWLRKSAKRFERYMADDFDRQMAASSALCRKVAKQKLAEGRGNELIATARRPS